MISVSERKFTVQEVADELRVDRSTISRYLSEGKLAHFRIGSRKLIAESHLAEFLKRSERPAKPARHI